MDIEYELGMNDIRSWNVYYVNHSQVIRNRINKTRRKYIFFTVICALIAIFWGMDEWITWVIIFGILAVGFLSFYLLFPKIGRKRALSNLLNNVHKDQQNDRKIFKLSITGEGVTLTTASANSSFNWNIVEKIVNTGSHLFLMIKGYGTVIIPKNSLSNGEFQQLI
jgi:hypothetical protein